MNDNYLWNGEDPVDPEIVRLEAVLATRRLPDTRVLVLPPPRARRYVFWGTAAATAALAAALTSLVWVQRAAGPSLTVTTLAGAPKMAARAVGAQGQLGLGHFLDTDADARARIDVGDIGQVEVDPHSRIGLVNSQDGAYRLRLERGTMHALIWAPPGRFVVDTPSSTAVDLGCAYSLSVDANGSGLLRVTSGWVGFDWRGRESFIPAGAVCATRRDLGPGTPRYEDTSDAFAAALDTLDFGPPGADRTAALDLVLAEARERDVVTLWHLLVRAAAPDRLRVFDRLAGFVPPPAGVTREGIQAGRREMLDQWWDALDLGTASWWRTWKQPWRTERGDQ